MDNSEGFHKAISEDRRYKRSKERIVIGNWEEMHFADEFELVVGDLVIGNVAHENVETLVRKIKDSLVQGGTFITKSFFFLPDRPFRPLDDVFVEYECDHPLEDPFPLLAYDLTVAAMDKKTHVMRFNKMHELLECARAKGLLSERTLSRYEEFGWAKEDSGFFVMPAPEWERLLGRYFTKYQVLFGPYSWSRDYPVYLAER